MKEITLTVIFEGTIYSIEEPNTHLHHILYHDCRGTRITSINQLEAHQNETHFKMGFNGCGIENGLAGVMFGAGLETQYNQVEAIVKELIKAGNKVKLNGIGLSRGGIAALLLAKKLGHIDSFHLETNLLLLDPVPGNLSFTPQLDIFNFTLTNQAMDLSSSKNLKYVETLYPYLEVGDDTGNTVDQFLANFHIPIRPTYPMHCEVREEVILGAHLRAFQDMAKNNEEENLRYGVEIIPIIKKLSKTIIYKFLSKVGSLAFSESNEESSAISTAFERDRNKWSIVLNNIITSIIPKTRNIHSQDNSQITVSNKAHYLNKTHRELIYDVENNPEDLCLKIAPERPYCAITQLPLTKDILLDLINIIESGMTSLSKQGKKGELLLKIRTDLVKDSTLTEEQLSFVLRDIIAITLQRDRYSYSFYRTTNSGEALVLALNRAEFQSIRRCLRHDEEPVNYSDLSSYTLGRDDLDHFNSQQKEANLNLIEEYHLGDDGFRFLLQ